MKTFSTIVANSVLGLGKFTALNHMLNRKLHLKNKVVSAHQKSLWTICRCFYVSHHYYLEVWMKENFYVASASGKYPGNDEVSLCAPGSVCSIYDSGLGTQCIHSFIQFAFMFDLSAVRRFSLWQWCRERI